MLLLSPTLRLVRLGTRVHRAQRGQVLVMAALVAAIVLGMAGLAIDVGFAMRERGKAANAADAAAMAGADVLLNGGERDVAISTALAYAQKNGYSSGQTTVHTPPTSGPHAGDDKYVEVSISSTRPTFFMRVLHIPTTTVATR
ncbi:MAG: hypothetical protein EPO22_05015, partial [Dehalococcoidia bacterium]